jgi:Protein of unknown function (DUF2892)
MKQNISIVNALMRITCGFALLAWSIAKMSKRSGKESYLIIAILAGMKIGEGILRYCPIVALLNNRKDMISDGDMTEQGKRLFRNEVSSDNHSNI